MTSAAVRAEYSRRSGVGLSWRWWCSTIARKGATPEPPATSCTGRGSPPARSAAADHTK
jgi:hypothetical protein